MKKKFYRLDKFLSQLVSDVKREGDNFLLKITHPNTAEILYSETIPLSMLKKPEDPWSEILAYAEGKKETIDVPTDEQKCVKKSRKGKSGKTELNV